MEIIHKSAILKVLMRDQMWIAFWKTGKSLCGFRNSAPSSLSYLIGEENSGCDGRKEIFTRREKGDEGRQRSFQPSDANAKQEHFVYRNQPYARQAKK